MAATRDDHANWWRSTRAPIFFLVAATVCLALLAALDIYETRTVHEQHATSRVEQAGRVARALAISKVNGLEAVTEEDGSPLSFIIDPDELEASSRWDTVLDEIAELNHGAANAFRYEAERSSFERFSTTFRTDEGERVTAPAGIDPGHPAYETVIDGMPFVGAFPVAGRERLVYLTPITDSEQTIVGLIAVDVGWLDEVNEASAKQTNRVLLLTVGLFALLATLGIAFMLSSSRPLYALSRLAHVIGTTDSDFDAVFAEADQSVLRLVERDDEVGYLARGLTKVVDLQRDLEYRAYHDLLTGLPNRAALLRELERRFDECSVGYTDVGFALVLMDLDGFKRVNDGLGHLAGDEVLAAVSSDLADALEPGEFAARLGGDEFAILTSTGVVEDDAIRRVSKRMIDSATGGYDTSAGAASVAASAGMAAIPRDGTTSAKVLSAADLALYEAKRNRPGTAKMYAPKLSEAFERQELLVPALRRALETEALELAYQPIYNRDGQMCTVEALCRWTHESEGAISPGEFIPIAEATGLIDALGDWVLEAACKQLAEWNKTHPIVPSVSVNVSSIQLQDEVFVSSIAQLLNLYPAALGKLTIELTESFAVDEIGGSHVEILRALSDLDVTLSIDDFGTGFSSLSYLTDLNVHQIKIDRSFVTSASKDDAQLLAGIVALGKGLGFSIIIEGVEFPDELALVQSVDYDGLQGFLLGRPMSADRVSDLFGMPHAALVAADQVARFAADGVETVAIQQ